MCGIISLFSNEPRYDKKVQDLMTNMLWIDSVRGFHSTGMIYETEGGVDYYKKAVAGYDFIELPLVDAVLRNLEKTRFFIGHNRAATLGSVNSQNAHPFEHGHILGVHNGTLTNFHNLTGVRQNFAVDSEHLFHAMSVMDTQELFPQVQGSYNLLWHDDRDDTIHICKNDQRPYTFIKIKGKELLVGASEKVMAKWLINRHGMEIEYAWSPKDNMEYIFEMDGDIIKPTKRIKHTPWVNPNPVNFYPPQNQQTNWNQNKNLPVPIHATQPKEDDPEAVLFFVEKKIKNQDVPGAIPTFTYHGTSEGDAEVVVYNAYEHEVELNWWYLGKGTWIPSQGGYWQINRMTLMEYEDWNEARDTAEEAGKKSTGSSTDSSEISLLTCVSCQEAAPADVVVQIKDSPEELMCLECVQAHHVKIHEVDKEDQWKLIQDGAY